MEEISLNISVREEQMEDKKVFIVNNEETGVVDFGDTLDEAIENFKKAAKLYLETYPEKKKELLKEKVRPIFVSRIAI